LKHKHQGTLLVIGIAIIVYGVFGLVFQIFNSSVDFKAVVIWGFANPLFVLHCASVGIAGSSLMFSSLSLLDFLAWPLLMIGLGSSLSVFA